MKPNNLCTLLTKDVLEDFLILKKSLELFNPDITLNVITDKLSKPFLKDDGLKINIIETLPELDYHSIKTRGPAFTNLVLKKPYLMTKCLELHGSAFFVDADIIFLNELSMSDNHQTYFSQHHIHPHQEKIYGRYNAGYVFTKELGFGDWWENTTKNKSKFFEQEGMIHGEKDLDLGKFSMNHNFGWWRLFQTDEVDRKSKFSVGDTIYYDKTPLISIHTHITKSDFDVNAAEFNFFIKNLMGKSKDKRHRSLLEFILNINDYIKNKI